MSKVRDIPSSRYYRKLLRDISNCHEYKNNSMRKVKYIHFLHFMRKVQSEVPNGVKCQKLTYKSSILNSTLKSL